MVVYDRQVMKVCNVCTPGGIVMRECSGLQTEKTGGTVLLTLTCVNNLDITW